jgi:hypothetical protein
MKDIKKKPTKLPNFTKFPNERQGVRMTEYLLILPFRKI